MREVIIIHNLDWTFTFEQRIDIWYELVNQRIKKALDSKQRHPMMMDHRKGEGLYFKPGKDAYMSSNP
jgi:hypothetical protein